jgi:predicted ATPase
MLIGLDGAEESYVRKLVKRLKKERLSDIQIVTELVRIIQDAGEKALQTTFKLQLERAFGPKLSSLININASYAKIETDIFRNMVLIIELRKRDQVTIHLNVTQETIEDLAKQSAPILEKIRLKRQKQRYIEELVADLQGHLSSLKMEFPLEELLRTRAPLGRTSAPAYYVPAGRGGLIESIEIVVDSLIYEASIAPTEGISMAPLPGMAAQFYRVLRSLRGSKGPLSKDVAKLFKELLGGDIRLLSISLRKGERPIRTRMMYDFHLGNKRSSTELIHAASMIKELAPIYLLVQELLSPGQLLIVEEPESHLHPGAQLRLSRILAVLTKYRVSVFLTTHSTIILRKISHLTGRLPDEKESLLSSNSVAMYWLKESKRGSVSKRLRISKQGALDEIPTFDEAVNELYEEEETLQREMRQEETTKAEKA